MITCKEMKEAAPLALSRTADWKHGGELIGGCQRRRDENKAFSAKASESSIYKKI